MKIKSIASNLMSSLVASFIFTSFSQANCQSAVDNVNAVVGLGIAGPADTPDYNLSSNALSSTHEGKATPQYMLGLAYPLSVNYFHRFAKGDPHDNSHDNWDRQCGTTVVDQVRTQDQANVNSVKFRCQPLGVFVSAKFSTESSSTVNGVTFGLTHKIAGNLSLLVAGSLSPFVQPSPGFINAAVQTVNTQKALNNPLYSLFDPAAMKVNAKDAFDGFPTVLMVNSGTVSAPSYTSGGQIYSGNVLITNYKPGFMIGVALTPNAIKLLTGAK